MRDDAVCSKESKEDVNFLGSKAIEIFGFFIPSASFSFRFRDENALGHINRVYAVV